MSNPTDFQMQQQEEARNRNAGAPENPENPPNPVEDGLPIGDPPPEPIDRNEPEPERGKIKPIYMSPADQKRQEFAKRFKRDGDNGEGDVPFNGDANDPEMLYGIHGRQGEPEPAPEPKPAPAAAPEKTFTIKVRGKDIQLTQAELLERASKVEAADSYLEEGRNLLEQARQVRKNSADHAGADPHRPEGDFSMDDELNPDLATESDQRTDPLVQAIEEIQFGDPKEAAGKLRKVIAQASDENANTRQIQRLMQQDSLSAIEAVRAFKGRNPELEDPDTERWITSKLFDLQRAEIESLGVVDAAKIPTDTVELANWHQFYRIHGAKVSKPEQLLEEAKGRFHKWKGVGPKPVQVRREAPRVEVNIDRNERRQNIPSQPNRTVNPRPDAATPQPQGSNRSNVIANMRKQRGQLTG